MRCITYAGENVVTTDEVAALLVELTAELAKRGRAEAVTIPIVVDADVEDASAQLVIGLGNDVLSVPHAWDQEVPDFSEAESRLQGYLDDIRPSTTAYEPRDSIETSDVLEDPDLDLRDFAR
ncbi:hypothetical protein SAMN06295974_1730 [Plantibacter flavus]|uniref:Uncharacterized protein n=1 Tax=Plantibacter flavus TaxID=150123 RepID=A0A3N2C819_9MICO|nr:hypothetical protein [Plantibacter flavus]ROR83659.1 hypothetical protein EDD42_3773 [Plantibacter flavus]SMG25988.1 hypothetical protein SAMN06295974_1730 [Plantibacter flavus]